MESGLVKGSKRIDVHLLFKKVKLQNQIGFDIVIQAK